jgi:SAM-dependent methyltransferase
MDNYEFCTRWIAEQDLGEGVRVLDYGCGAGTIVRKLRDLNIDAYGCDVFYEGGDYSKLVDTALPDDAILRMDENVIPFDDESFDFVISNQVLEHVEDLDHVLAEMARVLKPDGQVISLFPDRGVWREAHCGIPFLHWFPKYSQPRVYYAAAWRVLGFGLLKKDKTVMQWSRDFCEYIDRWTHYRTRREIDAAFNRRFSDLRHIEDEWLRRRLGRRKNLASWLPAAIQKTAATKLGCLVSVAHKSPRI